MALEIATCMHGKLLAPTALDQLTIRSIPRGKTMTIYTMLLSMHSNLDLNTDGSTLPDGLVQVR